MKPLALDARLARDGRASRPPELPAATAPETDVRLVRECLAGRQDAWASLLDKYKRLIYSIPVKYGLSPDEATDVFQDVCVELLAELPRLREPRALPKWLMQVAAHKCARLKARDRRAAQTESSEPAADALDRVADSALLSDEILVGVQKEQTLRDAVASLPPRCQQLIRMLFFETPPRPYREIAASLELASGSIGFIRGRCLQRLRTYLQKNGFQ